MLRQQTGCFEVSKPIEIILSLILLSPQPWRCWARWIKREQQQRRGWHSIQASLLDVSGLARRPTIKLISPDGSGFAMGCDWPGCRRGDVRCWPAADVRAGGRRVRFVG